MAERDRDLVDVTITAGHAFGGDHEAVARQPLGEEREAAGDETGVSAICAHGCDQRRAARCQLDAVCNHLIDDRRGETFEQSHALAQGRFEFEFAPHGALGNAADLVAETRHRAQFVDAFLVDHGGIHVRDQQLFFAALRGLQHHIDLCAVAPCA